MGSLQPYNLWRSSFSNQRRTKCSPEGLRPLGHRHVTRDRTQLLLREATLSWWAIKYVPCLEKHQFSPHLMVADHLSLPLDPVAHCLDAKLCFSSSCYQMLSNGGWPWEEAGSGALRADGLWTVLSSWALLHRSVRNWCLNVARASGEK